MFFFLQWLCLRQCVCRSKIYDQFAFKAWKMGKRGIERYGDSWREGKKKQIKSSHYYVSQLKNRLCVNYLGINALETAIYKWHVKPKKKEQSHKIWISGKEFAQWIIINWVCNCICLLIDQNEFISSIQQFHLLYLK